MLLAIYSAFIVLLDLLSLQFKLIFSLLLAIYHFFKPTRMKSLSGENVMITGAGHGIGRELALQLAEQGARIALWDVDASRCEETAREIKAKGGRAISYCCDISDRCQVLETAAKVKREIGIVGLVINNAGLVPIHPLLDHNPQQIQRVFDVNVISHFWILEAFLPAMIASNHGHIAAICSMTGLVGSANLVPYSSSKFAVRGLMQALGEELKEDARKPNIHLTTIYPFIVNTGQVQRPRLRFPKLLGIQKPSHAAEHIISAIRTNQREASVPGWLLPLHNIARALPSDTFDLLKDFVDSGAEAHDPAWKGDFLHQQALAVPSNSSRTSSQKPSLQAKLSSNSLGSTLTHRHANLIGELVR